MYLCVVVSCIGDLVMVVVSIVIVALCVVVLCCNTGCHLFMSYCMLFKVSGCCDCLEIVSGYGYGRCERRAPRSSSGR